MNDKKETLRKDTGYKRKKKPSSRFRHAQIMVQPLDMKKINTQSTDGNPSQEIKPEAIMSGDIPTKPAAKKKTPVIVSDSEEDDDDDASLLNISSSSKIEKRQRRIPIQYSYEKFIKVRKQMGLDYKTKKKGKREQWEDGDEAGIFTKEDPILARQRKKTPEQEKVKEEEEGELDEKPIDINEILNEGVRDSVQGTTTTGTSSGSKEGSRFEMEKNTHFDKQKPINLFNSPEKPKDIWGGSTMGFGFMNEPNGTSQQPSAGQPTATHQPQMLAQQFNLPDNMLTPTPGANAHVDPSLFDMVDPSKTQQPYVQQMMQYPQQFSQQSYQYPPQVLEQQQQHLVEQQQHLVEQQQHLIEQQQQQLERQQEKQELSLQDQLQQQLAQNTVVQQKEEEQKPAKPKRRRFIPPQLRARKKKLINQ